MAKDTFTSGTYKSKTFASGHWAGVGVTVTILFGHRAKICFMTEDTCVPSFANDATCKLQFMADATAAFTTEPT